MRCNCLNRHWTHHKHTISEWTVDFPLYWSVRVAYHLSNLIKYLAVGKTCLPYLTIELIIWVDWSSNTTSSSLPPLRHHDLSVAAKSISGKVVDNNWNRPLPNGMGTMATPKCVCNDCDYNKKKSKGEEAVATEEKKSNSNSPFIYQNL